MSGSITTIGALLTNEPNGRNPPQNPNLETRPRHPNGMGQPNDAPVVVWTNRGCAACVRAKQFLDRKGVAYTERRLKSDGSMQRAFARATGGARTVPQIIVGEQRVGGFDDLVNLDRTGELDVLLGRTESLPQLSFWQRVMRALKG